MNTSETKSIDWVKKSNKIKWTRWTSVTIRNMLYVFLTLKRWDHTRSVWTDQVKQPLHGQFSLSSSALGLHLIIINFFGNFYFIAGWVSFFHFREEYPKTFYLFLVLLWQSPSM